MQFDHYPENKEVSPFESKAADNYFVYGKNFSYLGNFDEIGSLNHPMDSRNHSFTGAFVIHIFKRYALVENGVCIFENPYFEDGHKPAGNTKREGQYAIIINLLHHYSIPSWGNGKLETYGIQNSQNPLQLELFPSAERAVQYAKKLSKTKPMIAIVVQLFSTVDRH